jgi:hypothetical protein
VRIFTGILVLLAGFASTDAYGAENKKYKGLSSISFVIEEVTEKARKCGFTTDGLKTAISYPIVTGTKLKVGRFKQLTIYARVTALSIGNQSCVASWHVRFYNYTSVITEYGAKLNAEIVLDDFGGIYKGDNSYVVLQIKNSIEGVGKKFAVQWNLDNQ